MPKSQGRTFTIIFVLVLCALSAALLGAISEFLMTRKEAAQKNYRNRQLLIASRIVSYEDRFQILQSDGEVKPALWQPPLLVPTETGETTSGETVTQITKLRVQPRLTDSEGKTYTFEELNIDYTTYLKDNEKKGFAHLPYKLYYVIMPNVDPKEYEKTPPYGYIFPISGYGLWDAIYGLLALKPNANTIIGISWYDQKETPGLGAEISEAWWQKQFFNKEIFQKTENGKVDFASAPVGINVVKPGNLKRLPLNKQESSVDGVTGATATSSGVQNALKTSLSPYRPLLINLHKKYG